MLSAFEVLQQCKLLLSLTAQLATHFCPVASPADKHNEADKIECYGSQLSLDRGVHLYTAKGSK